MHWYENVLVRKLFFLHFTFVFASNNDLKIHLLTLSEAVVIEFSQKYAFNL